MASANDAAGWHWGRTGGRDAGELGLGVRFTSIRHKSLLQERKHAHFPDSRVKPSSFHFYKN